MEQDDQPTTAETPPSSPKLSAEPLTHSPRRSSRAKRGVQKFEDDDFIVSPRKTASRATAAPKERVSRPKRKAAAAAAEVNVTEDGAVVLDQIIAPMAAYERSEYKGWVEIESEPGFFNAMLHLLGAQDFKVQELFGLDESGLEYLPKPVHGLIYLFQYTEATTLSEDRQDCPSGLWFGNQTTANACATVALMNIIMNVQDTALGPELQAFKDATMSLPPPHRGYMLDKNDFIRGIHNSLARRKDLVSEDLVLDNKMELAEKKRRVQRKKPARSNKSRKRADSEQTFHYIAYVPVAGQVWELDGFETQPLCLGPSSGDTWLDVASEAIRRRMMADEYLQCSLLAVCQSPLCEIVKQLAHCSAQIRSLEAVSQSSGTLHTAVTEDTAYAGGPVLAAAVVAVLRNMDETNTKKKDDSTTNKDCADNKADVSNDQPLSVEAINTMAEAAASKDKEDDKNNKNTAAATNITTGTPEKAESQIQQIRSRQAALMAEYAAEVASRDEGLEMMRERQRDYTPAIHRWVQILAEKGLLRELIAETGAE